MSYPDYPKNRLIVNGTDLTEKFKMVLADGYTLEPPEPKTYTVDIAGSHGKLDLTESLMGDVAYNNRKQTFLFYVINTSNFEAVKRKVSNFLHGKAFDYRITMDPGYTYHGRFKVTEYAHSMYASGITGVIKVEIDANPFKMKDSKAIVVDAVGGKIIQLESGRMRVVPVVESDGLVKVIFNNKLVSLQQGTWRVNDLIFTEGWNEIYLNSFDIRYITWGDLKRMPVSWAQFKAKRLFEWYKTDGSGNAVTITWSSLADNTWADYSEKKWSDLIYEYEKTTTVKNVYLKYDWGDL